MSRASGKRNGFYRHGLSTHPLYDTWISMMQRCYRPNHTNFSHYGGRGIFVCDRWHDPHLFIEDVSPRPKGKTLDRINNSGPYSRENCRWVTKAQQLLNTRKSKFLTL